MIRLFRIIMMVCCFGMASLAHASAHHDIINTMQAPLTIEQHSATQPSAKFTTPVPESTDFSTCQVMQSPENNVTKNTQSSSLGHNVNLGIGYSSRMANLARHEPEEVTPHYELASEIPAIPVEQLVIGYQEKPKPTVNWALNSYSSSSRVSAWKESNLLYSQRLYPHS
ncbi:hypothetical protein [Aliivibrio logei]|uniref:hypothetical protein n=1 Tax=Aliivibrio logei TaxID=688 RepID=UPI0035C8ABDB